MRRLAVFPVLFLLLMSGHASATVAFDDRAQTANHLFIGRSIAATASLDEPYRQLADADDSSSPSVRKIDNAPVDAPVLTNASVPPGTSWMQRMQNRLDQIWRDGTTDLYVTGYAWHNPAAYTAKKRRSFNDTSYGGGLGKGLFDEDGDWHALYAMAFLDSHSSPEPIAGYAFQKIARPSENTRLGIGYTAFMTSRQDIFHRIPFPGVLPLVSAGYGKGTLFATYIPGGKGNGNVAFVFGNWTF
jgi:palmitoyl transferase